MALTRKYLNALGIEQDKVDEIINAHSDTVNGLKGKIDQLEEQIESYQKDAEAAKEVQKELDGLKKTVEAEAKEREGKDYGKLLKEFEDYKAEQQKKEVRAEKEAAYRQILKDAGVPEKHFAKILKYSDVDGVELDEKGKIKTAKELMKTIKEEWFDHIEKTNAKGAETENPPAGSGGTGMTIEQIDAIEDTAKRQKAILDNHELFGF